MTDKNEEDHTDRDVIRVAKKFSTKTPSERRKEKVEKVVDKAFDVAESINENIESKTKQRIIYYGVIILTIFGLYYFMSPYRNCIRETDEMISEKYSYSSKNMREKRQQAKLFCISKTSW